MDDDKIFGETKITELVQWGQGKVVIYSEDKAIFDQFAEDKNCLNSQAYRRNGKFLAGDCFFDKKYRDSLAKRLKRLGIIKWGKGGIKM